jgi:glutamine synthetase
MPFLALVASVLHAVHRHGALLCAAAASAGNELRLGEDGAPSSAISVSLCGQLAKIFAALEDSKGEKGKKREAADGSPTVPIAFTGTGFEFRTLGGSINPSIFVTVINTIVAESIMIICDKIKKGLAKGGQDVTAVVKDVLSAVIRESKPALFDGGSRSSEPMPAREALKAFVAPKSVELFKRHAVFSEAELTAMYDARLNQYCKTLDVEIKTLADMVNTRVLPSACNYQADIASGLEVLRVLADDMTIEMTDGALEDRKEMFEKLTADIYHVRRGLKELSAMADKARGMETGERAAYLFKEVKPQMEIIRKYVDALEGSMPDEMWQLPKYREMLFML